MSILPTTHACNSVDVWVAKIIIVYINLCGVGLQWKGIILQWKSIIVCDLIISCGVISNGRKVVLPFLRLIQGQQIWSPSNEIYTEVFKASIHKWSSRNVKFGLWTSIFQPRWSTSSSTVCHHAISVGSQFGQSFIERVSERSTCHVDLRGLVFYTTPCVNMDND